MRRCRIALALCCALILAAACMGVPAAAEETSVRFVNRPVSEPALYVRMQAESLLADAPADPDTRFTLTLYVNGAPADGVTYERYDEDLAPVEEDATGGDGTFTLRAGQCARFLLSAEDAYEVSHTPPADFTQVTPAGGASAVGEVAATPTMVTFLDQYLPSSGASSLSVTAAARVLGSGSYDGDTAFQFYLRKKDGGALGQQTYTVDSGASDLERQTESDGRFTLTAGQTARFPGLEPGIYAVTEVLDEEYLASWTLYSEADGAQVRELTLEAEVSAEEAGSLLFTNCFTPARVELPETGGPGAGGCYAGGACMALTGLLLLRGMRRGDRYRA